MSMNVKSPSPPFIFFVKNCDPPSGSSKIFSDPPLPPDKHVCGISVAQSSFESQISPVTLRVHRSV